MRDTNGRELGLSIASQYTNIVDGATNERKKQYADESTCGDVTFGNTRKLTVAAGDDDDTLCSLQWTTWRLE
jgi:hypothetical protein